MTSTHAFWLAGRQVTGEDSFDVTSPWDGRVVGTVSVPTDAQIEGAVAAAYAVRDEFAATPAHVRAAALDPWDPEPLLAKGLIESRIGRGREAIDTFRDAVARQRDNYASHYFLARALAPTDLAEARAEAAEALRLNPLDLSTRQLNRRLSRRTGA